MAEADEVGCGEAVRRRGSRLPGGSLKAEEAGCWAVVRNRLSEFQKVESGIAAGGHPERWGNRSKGVFESRVICGLEIPRGY